jgi:hypothetical protein
MSRLASHQNKQFKKKLTMYVIALVGLVIFMVTIGLRLLVNASLFIGNLAPGKETAQEKKDEFFGALSIDSIPSATNSAEIEIVGSITNYNTLEFYINDDKVEEKKFSSSDTFTVKIGDLVPGENEVYVRALEKKAKQEKETDKYIVVYKNEKPTLEVSEPSNDTKTRKQEIKVAGKTTPETFIKVNGLPLVVTSDGQFQTSVRLKEGENKIEVVAEDDAGNSETKTVTVIREKDE